MEGEVQLQGESLSECVTHEYVCQQCKIPLLLLLLVLEAQGAFQHKGEKNWRQRWHACVFKQGMGGCQGVALICV